MKSLICPSCGCIAHISDHMEQVKDYANCEMCGSSLYLYDGEIDPFTFPGQKAPEDADSKKQAAWKEERPG